MILQVLNQGPSVDTVEHQAPDAESHDCNFCCFFMEECEPMNEWKRFYIYLNKLRICKDMFFSMFWTHICKDPHSWFTQAQ